MSSNADGNLTKGDSILSRRRMSGSVTPTFEEMRGIVWEAVQSRMHLGHSEAVFQVARELGLSPRRVVSILRSQIRDVWASELERGRQWYAQHCALQAQRLAHEAELYRERAEKLRSRLDAPSKHNVLPVNQNCTASVQKN